MASNPALNKQARITRLSAAIDRLAALFEYGELLAATNPAALFDAAAHEIARLRRALGSRGSANPGPEAPQGDETSKQNPRVAPATRGISTEEKRMGQKRFEVIDYEAATDAGLDVYGEERHWLVEHKTDGTLRILGSDGGEPEDNTFTRDWSWVVGELNKLAEKG